MTARQLEVIALVADGLPTKEIAARLGVSEAAVKKHLGHLMARYDVPNRAALVRAGIANGILRVSYEPVTSEGLQRHDSERDGGRIEVQASLDLSREDLTKIAGSFVAVSR